MPISKVLSDAQEPLWRSQVSDCIMGCVNDDIITSDCTVRPPLFRDQISNCINLLRPNPNRTRHRI